MMYEYLIFSVCDIYKCYHGECYLESVLVAKCRCHVGYTGNQCQLGKNINFLIILFETKPQSYISQHKCLMAIKQSLAPISF